MPKNIILVESLKDWQPDFPAMTVVTAKDYLTKPEYMECRDLRVINLCRSYRYLSTGYFCSLLAEPRRHKIIPSIKTITNLSRKSIYNLNVEDLDADIQKALKKHPLDIKAFDLLIFFGHCEGLAKALYKAERLFRNHVAARRVGMQLLSVRGPEHRAVSERDSWQAHRLHLHHHLHLCPNRRCCLPVHRYVAL